MGKSTILIPRTRNQTNTFVVGRGDLLVTNFREMQAELVKIDKGLRAEMIREAKAVVRPAAADVKSAINAFREPSGTHTNGRLGWNHQMTKRGGRVRPDKVQIQFRTGRSRDVKVVSLVAIKVPAPMTVIADMSGRSGRYVGAGYQGSGYSALITKGSVTYRYKLNGQGDALIRALNRGGRPSRMVYPAVEKDKPQMQMKISMILTKYANIVNRRYK